MNQAIVYKYTDEHCSIGVYFVGAYRECEEWIQKRIDDNYSEYLEKAIEMTFEDIEETLLGDWVKNIDYYVYEGVVDNYLNYIVPDYRIERVLNGLWKVVENSNYKEVIDFILEVGKGLDTIVDLSKALRTELELRLDRIDLKEEMFQHEECDKELEKLYYIVEKVVYD